MSAMPFDSSLKTNFNSTLQTILRVLGALGCREQLHFSTWILFSFFFSFSPKCREQTLSSIPPPRRGSISRSPVPAEEGLSPASPAAARRRELRGTRPGGERGAVGGPAEPGALENPGAAASPRSRGCHRRAAGLL